MKKIAALTFSGISFLTITAPVFAEQIAINPCPQAGNAGGLGFFSLCTLAPGGNMVSAVITLLFVVATLIAFGFLIFGGIKWITSGGDKAGVEEARNMIVAALVGLVVTFLSFFIINFVLSIFGLGSISNLQIPDLTP